MIETAPTIEGGHQGPVRAPSEGEHTTLHATVAKRRGRPVGTDYRAVDGPLHEEMRALLQRRAVPTLTAAARSVAERAYGGGTAKSKATRLVRSYPYAD
jgi:hypothetical protein